MGDIFKDIKHMLQLTALVLVLFPICWLIPTGAEYLQHAVEINLGLYHSEEAFAALQENGTRTSTGLFKAFAVFFVALIIVPRYLIHGSLVSRSSNLDNMALAKGTKLVGGIGLAIAIGLVLSKYLSTLYPIIETNLFIKIHLSLLPLLALNFAYEKFLPRDIGVLYSIEKPVEVSKEISRKIFKSQFIYIVIMCSPIVALHIKLNNMAMNNVGQHIKLLLLTFDSLLIGLLAVCMGTAIAFSFSKITGCEMLSQHLSSPVKS